MLGDRFPQAKSGYRRVGILGERSDGKTGIRGERSDGKTGWVYPCLGCGAFSMRLRAQSSVH